MNVGPADSNGSAVISGLYGSALNSQMHQNLGTHGFTGGLDVGYNYQINQFVVGVEGDFQYTDLTRNYQSGSIPNPGGGVVPPGFIPPAGFVNTSFSSSVKSDWLSTFRTRLGFATGNFLGFITGGLAVSEYSFTSGYNTSLPGFFLPPGFSAPAGNATASKLMLGWTIGAGAEYALADKWSVKAEYMYVGFENTGNAASTVYRPFFGSSFPMNHGLTDISQHIVKVGVNYRF